MSRQQNKQSKAIRNLNLLKFIKFSKTALHLIATNPSSLLCISVNSQNKIVFTTKQSSLFFTYIWLLYTSKRATSLYFVKIIFLIYLIVSLCSLTNKPLSMHHPIHRSFNSAKISKMTNAL